MKKVWFVVFGLLFVISACAINDVDTEKFKNPLFNQPLEPLSSGTGWGYITPTSVEFRTPLDKNLMDSIGKCKLIENEENRITFFCNIKYNHYNDTEIYQGYYVFEIRKLFMDDCMLIYERYFKSGEDYTASLDIFHSAYCVTPPKNYKLPISD